MSATFKIRIILLLLTLSCAATALLINFTYSKDELLDFDAKTLETRLHNKEKFINDYLSDSVNFNALRSVHKNPKLAINLIQTFRDVKSIYVHTYKNNQLVFWGANRVAPQTDAGLTEGSNRIKTHNGWYEAIKKTSGSFSVVCIIPLKAEYKFQNSYLKNVFAEDLIKDNNLEIAGLSDKKIYTIRNIGGDFMLSVKLKSSLTNTFYSTLELSMWALAVLFATIFINYLSVSIASKGHVKAATCLFFLYFLIFRIYTLYFPYLDTVFNVSLFDPRHFNDGFFLPSLGDYLLNTIIISWFLCFIYSFRKELRLTVLPINKIAGIIIFTLLGLIIYLIASQQSDLFYALIIKSNINFDLTNILNLTNHSWIAIFLLYVSAFNLYLVLEIILAIGDKLPISNLTKLKIFINGIIILLLINLILGTINVYIPLFCIILFIRGYCFYTKKRNYRLVIFLFSVLIFSIIASIKLSSFEFEKERELRKVTAYKLESADDPNAVLLFLSLEQEMSNDEFIKEYFRKHTINKAVLDDNLKKLYFEGYLSRYEFETFTFTPGQEYNTADSTQIHNYRNLVLAGSIKVSENFYRVNNTFGFQNYFAILPVKDNNQQIGTLIITLKSKTFKNLGTLPEVLIDSKMISDKGLDNYSFAFYLDGHLLNQNGNYTYNLINNTFPGKINQFIFTEQNGYSHLIYQSNAKKLIVVSRPISSLIMKLASVSFMFLVMILLTVFIGLLYQVWVTFHDENFMIDRNGWKYLLSRHRILYKTRIQASLVVAIAFTLLMVSLITYFSISNQFKTDLEKGVIEQVNQINSGLEKNKIFKNEKLMATEDMLRTFSEINATDLNLYDVNGRLLFTTQYKIYDNGFLEPRMNSLAYIYLRRLQRSEYLNEEQVGRMKYITAYQPLRNDRNETIAYLSIPRFSFQRDYDSRIGHYLNTLINVYALVLIIIAIFAIFLANQITFPLTLVSKSLSEVSIDGKNEPIKWESNDEIGSLIKEYNTMILALEESARKLARSERESAWREMAKQVAHEIKNPLTPLKLGVQLLEKSWRENDPNFSKKFERFSKSFIEQIESLALIASEFSNFAKLPDTPFSRINLVDIIERSVEIYANSPGLQISFKHDMSEFFLNGSKDHLLRIFNNLIKNAIEAIPETEPGYINLSLKTDGQFALITLSDNGKGIPEDLKDIIFNPNFTTKSSGTGLGLAFVKQAIENMLGTITFVTEQDKGTTFYLRLPIVS
ncbi:Nitrogen regulation protein NtrY [Arcticibacter svalbardensis MN12-7]|uniref:histidine kinase n=1 Tax=Arcticibacter svalbardensis MN12-7 TaxID=1150600 RepID=R9GRX3_9SPHI|nr:ATP-binding protein [Arcticibacter svalbardensis]EOR94448.1 Nitrogen regulation protein NtrY [Arcticibacter svalbardensis MN12-7]